MQDDFEDLDFTPEQRALIRMYGEQKATVDALQEMLFTQISQTQAIFLALSVAFALDKKLADNVRSTVREVITISNPEAAEGIRDAFERHMQLKI